MDRYEFLDSIHLGFVPDEDFYLTIYKYDLSYPGFRDLALNELNRIGHHNAWKKYAEIVTRYEAEQYVKKLEEENQDAEYEEVCRVLCQNENGCDSCTTR